MNSNELNFKKWLESDSYTSQKAVISAELNTPEPSGRRYAHISLQSPGRANRIDYTVFKQTPEQKGQAIVVKAKHREELQKAYGNGWKKRLNIPSNTLAEPIRMTF